MSFRICRDIGAILKSVLPWAYDGADKQRKLTDSILGDDGERHTAGTLAWGAFRRDFTPTGKNITILVDAIDRAVTPSQGPRYREIEERYEKLIPEILTALFPDQLALDAADHFRAHFRLDCIDIRSHLAPSRAVLHYRTDLEYDWHVRLAQDFRVESWGESD